MESFANGDKWKLTAFSWELGGTSPEDLVPLHRYMRILQGCDSPQHHHCVHTPSLSSAVGEEEEQFLNNVFINYTSGHHFHILLFVEIIYFILKV